MVPHEPRSRSALLMLCIMETEGDEGEEGTILDVILNAHTRMKRARCNWATRGYMATRASVLTSDKSAACS